MKHPKVALALLVGGCACTYLWMAVPSALEASVWNITGALNRIFQLCLLGLAFRSREVWLVVLLLSLYDLQVVGCTAWYMIDPWVTLPGDERCSTKAHVPLGLVGAIAALALVVHIVKGRKR